MGDDSYSAPIQVSRVPSRKPGSKRVKYLFTDSNFLYSIPALKFFPPRSCAILTLNLVSKIDLTSVISMQNVSLVSHETSGPWTDGTLGSPRELGETVTPWPCSSEVLNELPQGGRRHPEASSSGLNRDCPPGLNVAVSHQGNVPQCWC